MTAPVAELYISLKARSSYFGPCGYEYIPLTPVEHTAVLNALEDAEALAQVTAERDRLRQALVEYGRHADWCGHPECDCGYTEALDAPKEIP